MGLKAPKQKIPKKLKKENKAEIIINNINKKGEINNYPTLNIKSNNNIVCKYLIYLF